MNNLIPTPKLVSPSSGTVPCQSDVPARIVTHGREAKPAGDWLAGHIGTDLQVATCRTDGGAGGAIHLRLLDRLVAGGVADEGWRSSRAFNTPVGREQGYVLDVTTDSAAIAARGPHGLQHGAATLLQLLRVEEGTLVAPCCRIEDWPDFRFRVGADWLLNVEINRWGYERGDGREALLARMKRKLELAARHKINVVWFDGFGWDTGRVPGYVDFARELGAYASERHIRLAYAGYGGGYGFAYRRSQLYPCPYQGRMFENRRSYPDGESYDCAGLANRAVSRRYGTCLSNAALAELKLAELVEFVRECRPGMLYIHDIDSGGFERTRQGWKLRCARCRERWPDDELASARGAAAAYGDWFRQVATAINAVETDDGRYVAARDCELLFVGPMYTVYRESDEIWSAACDYFAIGSQHLGPCPNAQFGIREQFVSDDPSGPRVATLKRRLNAVGHGHGVMVVPFVGGDNYYNDQLVSVAPALHRYYQGADTVYTMTFGSVAEPAQLVSAEYGWHSTAPGAFDLASSRAEVEDLIERCKAGVEQKAEIFGRDGLLPRACDRLYGPQAGPWLTQLFSLGLGTGVFPLVTGWGSATKEVARLSGGSNEEAGERRVHWQEREALTRTAISLAESALNEPLPDPHVRADIEWLRTGLEAGRRSCRALAACWQWLDERTNASLTDLLRALEDLEHFLADRVPTETTDPIGGDLDVWRATVEELRALSGSQRQ